MNAPDRSSRVAAWVSQNRALFTGGDTDAITRALLPPLCQHLNGFEGRDVWGLLVKTDRHPEFIPHDIIMWRDTGEHFDVFTGPDRIEDVQASWGHNNPPENPAWEWRSVGAVTTQPADPPVPAQPPTPPANAGRLAELEARIAGLVEGHRQLEERIKELENKPAPKDVDFTVEGRIGRMYGHAHPITLTVTKR